MGGLRPPKKLSPFSPYPLPHPPYLRQVFIPMAYKCVLLGDGGCGKTTFAKRHLLGEFTYEYNPTMGVEVHPLTFETTQGTIRFNVWDCAGQPQFKGLGSAYYKGADCAILMFDLTNRESYDHLHQWYDELVQCVGSIPLVVVGNKYELIDTMDAGEITFPRETGSHYYPISAKSNCMTAHPFVCLSRYLTRNPLLSFVDK
jgi:GTP-binding nuclear protein Ran